MKVIGQKISPTYTHNQSSASDTWVINHNLEKHPSITVVDSAETVVHGKIEYNSKNTVTITFRLNEDAYAFSGKAYLN
jgi:hypothetical protein|tara:strand:- start:26380 stop:26613 length:234 start_codon:yes stop_codon:yes gene_type:complete